MVKVRRRTETGDAPVWQGADEGEYRQYLTEEQRSQAGCSAGRMQLDFHHGLLGPAWGSGRKPRLRKTKQRSQTGAERRKTMGIDRAGFPFIGMALVPAVVCLAAGLPGVGLLLSGLPVGVALFFRDPERVPPQAPEAVVSPADGRVLYAGAADRPLAPPGDWLQISIFLSPLDVHVNRVPIAGQVTRVEHVPGSFLPAFRDGAATHNETDRDLAGACRSDHRFSGRLLARWRGGWSAAWPPGRPCRPDSGSVS